MMLALLAKKRISRCLPTTHLSQCWNGICKQLKTRPIEQKLSSSSQPRVILRNSYAEQSLVAFRRALALARPDDDIREVQQLQYLTAFLLYQAEQHFDAAVLGGFVATSDPSSAVARQCANVAMASQWQLYQSANGDAERDAATQRIVRIADFIARTWPSDPSAQDAFGESCQLYGERGQHRPRHTVSGPNSRNQALNGPAPNCASDRLFGGSI